MKTTIHFLDDVSSCIIIGRRRAFPEADPAAFSAEMPETCEYRSGECPVERLML